MRKTKILLVLLLALLPFIGWAQQNYYGQHVSIKLATGDSIQYDLRNIGVKPVAIIQPTIKDGKVIWSFQNEYLEWINDPEVFALDNVKSIDFRTKEYDEVEVRKALIEFYQALDGDHWIHNENWCSDQPIWEWYGVNNEGLHQGVVHEVPWVHFLRIPRNNLSGEIPEGCLSRMGPIVDLDLGGNNIRGGIPHDLCNMYSLYILHLEANKFSGTFPETLFQLPHLNTLDVDENELEGSLPEGKIGDFMSKGSVTWMLLYNNLFTGKVPDVIRNHPLFPYAWYFILPQKGKGLDLSDIDIPAPVFHKEYMDGTPVNSDEVYKNNKYTLIYKWGWWCPHSEGFNERLIPAYNAYKDKGFEIIGIHASETDKLPEYLEKHPLPWKNINWDEWVSQPVEQLSDSEDAVIGFIENWLSSPTLLLVDQNGNVVFSTLMDENGKRPQDGRQWKVFDILEEKFGPVGYNIYTSTDYSHDGEVVTMQEASEGQGIDIVFVGEGFTDKDFEDGGRFDQRMSEAFAQFFCYEPYASLRDRFNVYAVKAVSPNAEYWGDAKHAIDEDASKAFEYASKVPNLIPNRPMRVNVIYNNNSGGRSYCMMFEDNSYVCYSMDGVSSVLNHEAGGHGVGRLLDEYVEQGNEILSLPEENKTYLENVWMDLGWGANVDWRSNSTEIKWAKFINDARYAEEGIGVYEGSYLYGRGAYRPTENSMMRNNNIGFNAPSREEIYKRVMKESEGDGWTYDYETFVAFDAAGHQQFVNALNANRARKMTDAKMDRKLLTAPPVFLKGTWRDALKKNKK